MPEEPEVEYVVQEETQSHTLRYVLLAIAAIYVVASLYFLVDMHGRVGKLEQAQKAAAEENAAQLATLNKRVGTAESSATALASKLGMTQKELSARTAALQREQAASQQKLAESQKQIGQVATEVGGVKTELGGAKTDIASTRTDLEATKTKLEKTIGDLGLQSGLIAHTRDELEILKHKGDRNYYEFTLLKGSKPTPVSTVSLQLKKVDAKRGRFTLNVLADDRTIEKKDRTVSEPMQFYTGRDRNLYEVVVFTTDKNKVTGYLSTPKNAPVPAVQQTSSN
jgi:septal ring factor EnvC (AmiA/AmiB activator)